MSLPVGRRLELVLPTQPHAQSPTQNTTIARQIIVDYMSNHRIVLVDV